MSLSIIASSPSLELSGANVLVANLFDELQKKGGRAAWIVTGHEPSANDGSWLGERRFNIHHLPPTRLSNVRRRQTLLRDFLEQHSPCVYLPNFDFDMACAIPSLSPAVRAALVVHCDDPVYYNFVADHGNLFDAIVCVSEFLAEKLRAAHASLSERIFHIPFGVAVPARLPERNKRAGEPLEVAYCGRITFHQKRVEDLAGVIIRCQEESVAARFHIAGTGADERDFFERIRGPLAAGTARRLGFLPNADVLRLLERSDVLLMTSDFEGLPVILLEAMSRGCVPIVTRIKSGMTELVRHGENGFLLPVGDIGAFVSALKTLSAEPERLKRLRQAAYERVRDCFTLERAAADYRKLFESLMNDEVRWPALRTGKAIVPSHYRKHVRIVRRVKKLLGAA